MHVENYTKYDYIVVPLKLQNGKISNYKNPKDKITLNNFLMSNQVLTSKSIY